MKGRRCTSMTDRPNAVLEFVERLWSWIVEVGRGLMKVHLADLAGSGDCPA